MTWTIIKITKIDDHQKLSAPIRVAKLFAKTATVFAAESVSLYGNEVNTYIHTGRIAKILTIDGASPRVMGYFYKAIIQTVLLYGSESWTLTIGMIGRLRSFHHRVARYITGRHIKELEDGTYFCPSMKEVLKAAGMETIEVYMDRRRNTVRKYAATSAVYGRCIRSTAMSTNVNKVVWWEIKDSQNDVDNN